MDSDVLKVDKSETDVKQCESGNLFWLSQHKCFLNITHKTSFKIWWKKEKSAASRTGTF